MTTDTLEFPPIAPDAAPARTEVAAAAAQSFDIEKADLKTLAVARFGDWRQATAKTKADLSRTALDLSNQARVDEAKSLRHRTINVPLAAARATAKALKSKLADTSKAVGAELERIEAAWADVETVITPLIDAAQQKLDDAKAEAARVEAERKAKHEAGIATIRAYLTHAQQPGMTAERIAAGMDQLAAQTFPAEQWEEYAVPAADAQCQTLEAMRALHAQAQAREAEAARLAAEREAQAKAAAELAAERKRLADEAAALAAEKARLAEARRLIERAEAEAKARAETERQAAEEATRLQALEPVLLERLSDLCNDCIAQHSGYIAGVIESLEADRGDFTATPAVDAACTAALERMRGLLAEAQALEAKPVNVAGPLHLAPQPAPGLEFDHRGVLVPAVSAPITDPAAIEAAFESDDDVPAGPGVQYDKPPESLTLADAELQAAAHQLVDHIALAFASKFPSQPKMEPSWWVELRRLAERVEARL